MLADRLSQHSDFFGMIMSLAQLPPNVILGLDPGIYTVAHVLGNRRWIPAYAGMTDASPVLRT